VKATRHKIRQKGRLSRDEGLTEANEGNKGWSSGSVDSRSSNTHLSRIKVAQKSSALRQTLTLTRSAFGMLDSMRGEMPTSVFVEELLAKEKRRREREAFYRTAVASYTPDVWVETLKLNEETPIAAE
jgi:hypothetical protein